MRPAGLLFIGILALWGAGCSENVVSSEETRFPEKLGPYESFFEREAFELRRDDLLSRLPSGSLVILVTNDLFLRNGDVTYEFRPASTFYYLTGFDEPYSAAVVTPGNGPDRSESRLIMFVQERTDAVERWLGSSYGVEDAVELFGADEAYSIDALGEMIDEELKGVRYEHVYANLDDNGSMAAVINSTRAAFYDVADVRPIVDSQRAIKDPLELEAIRHAVDVSAQAFLGALEEIEPGVYEYEIDALFDYVLRVNGSPRAAFPTIVASGPNSNILHYDANLRQMVDGDLVMIDFGAEYYYYASDITRTLPVGGAFSVEQAAVYSIVLDAHRTVLDLVRPGISYEHLYERARDVVLDGLLEKGIITGERSEIIASGRFRNYIPAGLGHCVGLDVHDPLPRAETGERVLAENMVLAFEPHVYLAPDDGTVDRAYRGISVRIEDDVLVTGNGVEVLSRDVPTEISQIEAMMQ